MTQYQLTPLPAYAGHTISVGWRCPEHTFYISVADLREHTGDDEIESAHLWLPLGNDKITDAVVVVDLVRPYAEIPGHLLASLKADQARHTRQPRDSDPSGWDNPAAYDERRERSRAAADYLADQLRAGTAEQAADTLRQMNANGPSQAAGLILALILAQSLRGLDNAQLNEMGHNAMCGVAIMTSTEAHFAINTPTGFVTGTVQHPGAHLREILAAIGYGPDRYAYRDYGEHGAALLFCLIPA